MEFFQEMLERLNEANDSLDCPNPSDEDRDYARQLADKVFEVTEEMGGGILGDVDNQLLTKAREIEQKLSK